MALSVIESARISSIVEEALEKLSFLASITPDIMAHRDELSTIVGDEITRIIQEQRGLETRYEELIAQRATLKALSNKQKAKENQEQIQEVARALRESTKELCRNLKGNPNIAENLSKIQTERSNLQNLLSKTLRELRENAFSTLTTTVEEDKARNDMILEVIAKEKEVSAAVKGLQEDLANERQQHAAEVEERNDIISKLKEQLQARAARPPAGAPPRAPAPARPRPRPRPPAPPLAAAHLAPRRVARAQEVRTKSTIETKYLHKEAKARCESLNRIYGQTTDDMEEEIRLLRKQLQIEVQANEESEAFLRRKHTQLQAEIGNWNQRYEEDYDGLEKSLDALKQSRAEDLIKLNDYTERYNKEMEEKARREEEERMRAEMEALRAQEEERNAWAATKVQALWRGYLTRKAASSKGGKKGKGGKGKGKKKK
jgi:hypothetical protein